MQINSDKPLTSNIDDGNLRHVDHIPDEQIQNLFDLMESNVTPPSVLPQFTPPHKGLVITSFNTKTTYLIGDYLGEGSFGTVYGVTDVWKNDLAVKVRKPNGKYEQVQKAANNEFTKLLTLRHPNVTYVFDAFEFNHAFYIVTEKCYAPVDTLAKQMGTSVLMIERHYSHLQVIQVIEQLRGANTRKLIEADSRAAANYPSKKRAQKQQLAA